MKPARVDLERRRERVRRVQAKRPVGTVRATYRPRPGVMDRLIDLVVELLDEQGHSGQR